jgi:patatin-like phospholipase/acyl hydrolase
MNGGPFARKSEDLMENWVPQRHMGYLKFKEEYADTWKNQDVISGLLQESLRYSPARIKKKSNWGSRFIFLKTNTICPFAPKPPLSFDQSPKMYIIRPQALPFSSSDPAM